MTALVAVVLPILVGRAVNVAFRLGLAFGAAVEAVAIRSVVLSCMLFTSSSTSAAASTSAVVSSSSVVVSTCLVVVVVVVVVAVVVDCFCCCLPGSGGQRWLT